MHRQSQPRQQRVVVVDFGAQYGQLIARRVRDLKVYSEIVPFDVGLEELMAAPPDALILSGGPASVYAADAPKLDSRLLELGVPVLGFCYGMQAMAAALGGEVPRTDVGEYGPAELSRHEGPSRLLDGTPLTQTVWMSHRDSVGSVPPGFAVTASTSTTPIAAMEDPERLLYATQFHPEVHHTTCGKQMLEHFLFDIAGLEASWTMDSIVDEITADVRARVGDDRVILGLSGGVDSSVVAALLAHAIGSQLTCVFVNTGLLRKGEPEEVEEVFARQFDAGFVHVHAEERYARALAGVSDPEQKRRIIGSEFWRVFFEEAQRVGTEEAPVKWLAQGTIYPDVIESGSARASKSAATIKSHHNLIPFPEGVRFELIEPLRHLFKDEVRALGIALGLPDHIVHRQPFPGPGLAVRIIGEVTPERLEILREADAIVRDEIDAYNHELFVQTGLRDSERSVWQYFAVLPDIKSVGVMGDERTYAHPIIVRAVESRDAMTADWAKLPYDLLSRISSRVVAEVEGINRVTYDITPKPPGTIEWE
ncbi:MAG: glutamine-hydrolyzing GMP synthase [Coriobacteriales bacterium]|nr:glutamine-hydrolyzing GMP synthase [Coriobacteriales bacterium]